MKSYPGPYTAHLCEQVASFKECNDFGKHLNQLTGSGLLAPHLARDNLQWDVSTFVAHKTVLWLLNIVLFRLTLYSMSLYLPLPHDPHHFDPTLSLCNYCTLNMMICFMEACFIYLPFQTSGYRFLLLQLSGSMALGWSLSPSDLPSLKAHQRSLRPSMCTFCQKVHQNQRGWSLHLSSSQG